jgi:hypothetical protein
LRFTWLCFGLSPNEYKMSDSHRDRAWLASTKF